MERLIEAQDFETLCQLLSRALDEFMEGIYLQGYNRSNAKVAKVLDYIATHYRARITLAGLAKHVGLSPFRVSHLVKEATGRSVLQIVQVMRIQQAQKLLDTTAKSCTEVAYEVGYNDQSYFTKHFKRHAGITPARYRRRHGIVRPAPVA
jgi:AraC family transcriptional regulator of arabinose operon